MWTVQANWSNHCEISEGSLMLCYTCIPSISIPTFYTNIVTVSTDLLSDKEG
jgi:hypothetical protein